MSQAIITEIINQFYANNITLPTAYSMLSKMTALEVTECASMLPEVLILSNSLPLELVCKTDDDKANFKSYSKLLLPLVSVTQETVRSVVVAMLSNVLISDKHNQTLIKLGISAVIGMTKKFGIIKHFFSLKGTFNLLYHLLPNTIYGAIVANYFVLNTVSINRIKEESIELTTTTFEVLGMTKQLLLVLRLKLTESTKNELINWALRSPNNVYTLRGSQYLEAVVRRGVYSGSQDAMTIACCVSHTELTRIVDISSAPVDNIVKDVIESNTLLRNYSVQGLNTDYNIVVALRVLHTYLDSSTRDKALLISILRNPALADQVTLLGFCSFLMTV